MISFFGKIRYLLVGTLFLGMLTGASLSSQEDVFDSNMTIRDMSLVVKNVLTSGNCAKLQKILEAHPDAVYWTFEHDNYPLHIAAYYGYETMVELLIAYHANINTRNMSGNTPLDMAAKRGHLSIIESLVAAGAGIKPYHYFNTAPLGFAIKNGHTETAVYLREIQDFLESVHMDSIYGIERFCSENPTLVTTLLHNKTEDPLGVATLKGHLAILRLLLPLDPTLVNALDKDGETLLHKAVKKGHRAVAEFLLSQGAHIEAKDEKEKTPLHYAAENGHLAVVQLLVSKGAVVDAHGANDSTPLHWASQEGHLDVVKVLVANGAGIHLENKIEWTPLHYATWKGHQNVAEFLLQLGADIEAIPKNHESTLGIALSKGHTDFAKKLVLRYATVGELEDEVRALPSEVLEERREALIAILENPSLDLPRDLQRLITSFVVD